MVILTDTHPRLPHVPNNRWIKLWQFLQHIQVNLQMEECVICPLQEQDQTIMDEALTQGWTDTPLKYINAYRLYLQVQYMSELTTGQKSLPKTIQNNTQQVHTSKNKTIGPYSRNRKKRSPGEEDAHQNV